MVINTNTTVNKSFKSMVPIVSQIVVPAALGIIVSIIYNACKGELKLLIIAENKLCHNGSDKPCKRLISKV